MGKKIYFWFTVVISAVFLTSTAVAQQEQWLQYHSARQAQRIVGDMASFGLKLTSEKPQGVELPQFKSDELFFALWKSPMVKGGQLWIALDRTRPHGHWDQMYIDSNENGHLNDETAITAYQMDQYYAYFGPVKVVFEVEDGPVTYHLNFRFYNYDNRRRGLYVSSGGWYEGTITLAGQKKHCTLIDQNANGTFNDKSPHSGGSDRIRIGRKDTRDTRFVGNYIEVDEVLYRPEIAQDGAFIKLTKAEDVTFANIELPETITEFSAGGENGLFIRKPEKGLCQLPVGKYRIEHWMIERKDDKDARWKLEGRWFPDKGLFDVAEDKETELSIGEPIISTLDVRESDSKYYFNQELKGRLGERIELTRNGARPGAPKLHIKNKDGSYDRSFTFEYG